MIYFLRFLRWTLSPFVWLHDRVDEAVEVREIRQLDLTPAPFARPEERDVIADLDLVATEFSDDASDGRPSVTIPGGLYTEGQHAAAVEAARQQLAQNFRPITEVDTQPLRIEDIPVPEFDPADDAGCPLYVEAMQGAELFAPELRERWGRDIVEWAEPDPMPWFSQSVIGRSTDDADRMHMHVNCVCDAPERLARVGSTS